MTRVFKDIHIVRLNRTRILSNVQLDKASWARVVVPDRVHLLVKLYAKEKGVTMQDAATELLGIGFRKVWDMEEEE